MDQKGLGDHVRIAIFDGKNYDNWAYRTKICLEDNAVIECIKQNLIELKGKFNIDESDSRAQIKEKNTER